MKKRIENENQKTLMNVLHWRKQGSKHWNKPSCLEIVFTHFNWKQKQHFLNSLKWSLRK